MNEQSVAAASRSASACQNWASRWRARTVGLGQEVPLLDGRLVPYVSLDNAASTPPLRDVVDAVQRFLPYYSSVHRGAGFKSRVSTAAYHDAHETLARFVGAETTTNTVVFGKNTTEAINKLAFRYPLGRRSVVLSTAMEHHSNDLPWRGRATVVRATVTPEGRVDEDDVDRLLAAYGERIALMTVSGASNVTGFVQPVHRLARKAHAVGAAILVDAAQLAPHRRIDVRPDDDPEHLDFVALSGHKMYAPFGTGVLVGRRDIFLQGAPEYQGGGTVDIVTPDEVHWAGLPDREEAGSPNVVGAVATAAAARALMDTGMENVERHEAWLTTYALERLQSLPGISLYGATDPHRTHDRVGVIAFNLAAIHHALVAAILGYEGESASAAAASVRSRTSLISWSAKNPTGLSGTERFGTGIARADRVWSASVSGSTTRPTISMPSSRCCSGSRGMITRARTATCPRAAIAHLSDTKRCFPPPSRWQTGSKPYHRVERFPIDVAGLSGVGIRGRRRANAGPARIGRTPDGTIRFGQGSEVRVRFRARPAFL